MAQKISVVLEGDLTGGPAEQTIRFAFDGTDYEIDLNAKNTAALRKQLAPYIEHARRDGRASSGRPGRTAANRRRSGDIRAWAKEHGLTVSERGRIPPPWSSSTTRPDVEDARANPRPGSNLTISRGHNVNSSYSWIP